MNEDQQKKVDQVNQEIESLTEQVNKQREGLQKKQCFMESPEILDAQSELKKQTDILNKIMDDSMSPELKDAFKEVELAQQAFGQSFEEQAVKLAEGIMQNRGLGVPEIPAESIEKAMGGIVVANKLVEDAIKAGMDPSLHDSFSVATLPQTEEELLAEKEAHQEMLKKMQEAGTDVTGIDVSQFLPDKVQGLEELPPEEALAAQQEQAQSYFSPGPETEEQFKPLMEANDAYMGKLNENQVLVFEAETELSKTEKNLETAKSTLQEILQEIGIELS